MMRVSNTKVSSFGVSKSEAKGIVEGFMNINPLAEFYQNEDTGVTVLVNREFTGSNTTRVSTAIKSPDEYKFRKLVGKYLAVNNMKNGKYIDLPLGSIPDFLCAVGILY